MSSQLARKKLFFSRTITAETGFIFRSASKSAASLSRFVSGTQRSAVSSKVHLNITFGWLLFDLKFASQSRPAPVVQSLPRNHKKAAFTTLRKSK